MSRNFQKIQKKNQHKKANTDNFRIKINLFFFKINLQNKTFQETTYKFSKNFLKFSIISKKKCQG
mgnify:CR=1 FL=1